MVGILISFWDSLFSGAMLVLGSVIWIYPPTQDAIVANGVKVTSYLKAAPEWLGATVNNLQPFCFFNSHPRTTCIYDFGLDLPPCNRRQDDITLHETNMAPDNRPSQKETSIPTIHFHVLCMLC